MRPEKLINPGTWISEPPESTNLLKFGVGLNKELQWPLAAYRRRQHEGVGAKWRAPRTHLHAEMVKKRRDPTRSPKRELEEALRALQAGDLQAVEQLMQREHETPVPEDWQRRYCDGARAYWDQFYRERTVNFFKDRHYLREECRDPEASILLAAR
eukprot:g21661.t1